MAWVQAPIDRFVLHRLEQENLKPAIEASLTDVGGDNDLASRLVRT
jgi:hypothetical protein